MTSASWMSSTTPTIVLPETETGVFGFRASAFIGASAQAAETRRKGSSLVRPVSNMGRVSEVVTGGDART